MICDVCGEPLAPADIDPDCPDRVKWAHHEGCWDRCAICVDVQRGRRVLNR